MKQKDLVEQIKAVMSKNNIAIQQLSFDSKVSQPQLHRIIKNGQSCKYDTLSAIAAAVGLEVLIVPKGCVYVPMDKVSVNITGVLGKSDMQQVEEFHREFKFPKIDITDTKTDEQG